MTDQQRIEEAEILKEIFVVYYNDGSNCVCDCMSMAQIKSIGEENAKIVCYSIDRNPSDAVMKMYEALKKIREAKEMFLKWQDAIYVEIIDRNASEAIAEFEKEINVSQEKTN